MLLVFAQLQEHNFGIAWGSQVFYWWNEGWNDYSPWGQLQRSTTWHSEIRGMLYPNFSHSCILPCIPEQTTMYAPPHLCVACSLQFWPSGLHMIKASENAARFGEGMLEYFRMLMKHKNSSLFRRPLVLEQGLQSGQSLPGLVVSIFLVFAQFFLDGAVPSWFFVKGGGSCI